jgi:hypothetical protein
MSTEVSVDIRKSSRNDEQTLCLTVCNVNGGESVADC